MAPAKYGFYLDEFDPYYNYYAVRHIVQRVEAEGLSGLGEYFTWTDTKSWFPEGRKVAESAQVGLHLSASVFYLLSNRIFGSALSLYDFVVLFPAFVGALLVFPAFLLARRISGTAGGVLASLVMAFSPSVIQRGGLGWFKSEPFALLLGTTASYLFLYSLDSNPDSRKQFSTALLAGILFGYANTAWGGSLFFGLVIGGALILATFYRLNSRSILNVGLISIPSTLLVTAISPRPGISTLTNPLGAFLLSTLIFIVIAHHLRTSSHVEVPRKTLLKVLLTLGLIVLALQSFDILSGVAGRYLTVVYPVYKTDVPLVESVAEHFTPTGTDYFSAYFVVLFLAGFGAIIVLKRRSFGAVYALTLGLLGVYLSASFSRLMVFSALSLAILAAVGFSELLSRFVRPEGVLTTKRKVKLRGLAPELKVGFSVVVIALLTIPVAVPLGTNWIASADVPNSITNGATSFKTKIDDWLDALDWIRNNTPQDAVIAAWWDYGYWITVMGNRTSLADNATINQTRIQRLARMYMSTESEAIRILRELKADYVLVYVVGTRIREPQTGGMLYVLGGGGDESKKQWFIKIGGLDINQFLYTDEFTPRPYFWENTLMGKMMPFELFRYVDPSRGGALVEGYAPGRTAIYTYTEKYSSTSAPLKLVYKSPSLTRPMQSSQELFAGVLIYELSG